ncbi:MAG: flagellar hook-length control protein FliK [Gammaproteobacteria bacterium]|nr:flagellar hook-length control protein FliK [Gammaproteobacteria bacterium]
MDPLATAVLVVSQQGADSDSIATTPHSVENTKNFADIVAAQIPKGATLSTDLEHRNGMPEDSDPWHRLASNGNDMPLAFVLLEGPKPSGDHDLRASAPLQVTSPSVRLSTERGPATALAPTQAAFTEFSRPNSQPRPPSDAAPAPEAPLRATAFASFESIAHSGATTQPAASTPSATAMTTLSSPITQPQWGEQFANKITWMVGQDVHAATIQLDPPELGPIRVSIAVNGDSAQVSLNAQASLTRDMMDANLGRLREALSEQGFTHVDVDVGQDQQREQTPSQYGPSETVAEHLAPEEGEALTWITRLVDHYA